MIRASKVHGQYHFKHPAADTVVLAFDDRHRRRMAMTGTRGLEFLLDLEHAVALRGGDALVLDDGRLVEVVAAPEPLLEIRGRDPLHLVRLAWHLGNRHLPTQIMAKALRIRRDHVIADMVRGLGGKAVEIEAPFDPEGGAYAPAHDSGAHRHGDHGHHAHDGHDHPDHHHHGDDHHGHEHHGHAHAHHGHDHDHHVHDEHCGHDHDHGGDHGHAHGHSNKHDH